MCFLKPHNARHSYPFQKKLSIMSEFQVELASIKDADLIARFNIAMAKETEDLELDPTAAIAAAKRILENEAFGKCYLIKKEESIGGSLILMYEFSDWKNKLYKWIQSVYVAPEYRNKGVFKTLFQQLLKIEVEQVKDTDMECAAIRLYVDHNNVRAKRVYEKLGMKLSHYQLYEMNFS